MHSSHLSFLKTNFIQMLALTVQQLRVLFAGSKNESFIALGTMNTLPLAQTMFRGFLLVAICGRVIGVFVAVPLILTFGAIPFIEEPEIILAQVAKLVLHIAHSSLTNPLASI